MDASKNSGGNRMRCCRRSTWSKLPKTWELFILSFKLMHNVMACPVRRFDRWDACASSTQKLSVYGHILICKCHKFTRALPFLHKSPSWQSVLSLNLYWMSASAADRRNTIERETINTQRKNICRAEISVVGTQGQSGGVASGARAPNLLGLLIVLSKI